MAGGAVVITYTVPVGVHKAAAVSPTSGKRACGDRSENQYHSQSTNQYLFHLLTLRIVR